MIDGLPWRWHQPGCECCECRACFTVIGCCRGQTGAVVEVYETAAPGVVLVTGNTNGLGELCLDLSAHQLKTLSYRVNKSLFAPFSGPLTAPCSDGLVVGLLPASEGAGTAGRLTVNLYRNDGTPVTSGQSRVFRPSNLVTPVATATHGAGGQVVFTGLPTGEPLLFNSGPTSGSSQTFPLFTLTCEGLASATEGDEFGEGQLWSITYVDCPRERLCCFECGNPIPQRLCLTDPAGPSGSGAATSGAAVDCSTGNFTTSMLGTPLAGSCRAQWTAGSTNSNSYLICVNGPVSTTPNSNQVIYYQMVCGVPLGQTEPGLYLRVERVMYCEDTAGPYGATRYCGALCFGPGGTSVVSGGVVLDFVRASSITCNPFSATFPMPSYTLPCWTVSGGFATSSGSRSFAGRTITVAECA